MALFKKIIEIPISMIELGVTPRIGRSEEDGPAMDALMASIRTNGVLQPIIVSELPGGRYEVVAGTRRVLASAKLLMRTIWAAVLTERPSRETADEIWLTENIIREDVPAALVQEIFTGMRKRYGSDAAIGTKLGLAPHVVRRYLQR